MIKINFKKWMYKSNYDKTLKELMLQNNTIYKYGKIYSNFIKALEGDGLKKIGKNLWCT